MRLRWFRVSGVPTRIHTEHDAWHLQDDKAADAYRH